MKIPRHYSANNLWVMFVSGCVTLDFASATARGQQEAPDQPPYNLKVTDASRQAERDVKFSEQEALEKAMNFLEAKETSLAIPLLKKHWQNHPEQRMIALLLGDILFREGEQAEARQFYLTFVQSESSETPSALKLLIHAHHQLDQIYQLEEIAARARYHRAVAIIETVRKWYAETTQPSRETTQLGQHSLLQAWDLLQEAPQDLGCKWQQYRVMKLLDQPAVCRRILKEISHQLPDPLLPVSIRSPLAEELFLLQTREK